MLTPVEMKLSWQEFHFGVGYTDVAQVILSPHVSCQYHQFTPEPFSLLHPLLCFKVQFTIYILNYSASAYYLLFQKVNKWATRPIIISWLVFSPLAWEWLVLLQATIHFFVFLFSLSLPLYLFSSSSLSPSAFQCQWIINYEQYSHFKEASYCISSGLAGKKFI